MILLARRSRDTEVKNKYMDTKGEEGVGGRNWEIEIDTYILLTPSIKEITSENLLYSTQGTLLSALW